MHNKVRIIGGQWRSRQLHFSDIAGLRPTPSRVRETLFNWLRYDIAGSRCLDLFAGSGALGFEAASRGAQYVLQVESHPLACQSLHENAQQLLATQVEVMRCDALTFLSTHPAHHYDVVFLDPPFHSDLATKTCQLLDKSHWLGLGTKIYVETEVNINFNVMPNSWILRNHKQAGEVSYALFEKQENVQYER